MTVWRPAKPVTKTTPSPVTITDAQGNVRTVQPDISGFTCWKHHVRDCHRCDISAGATVRRDRTLPSAEPDGLRMDRQGRTRRQK